MPTLASHVTDMSSLNEHVGLQDSRRNGLYIIIAASLLVGFITGRSLFFNIAYVFIGLLVFAFAWAWSATNWLHLHRQAFPRRAQVGHYVEERFKLHNSGPLPKLWLELYDQSTLPGHRANHVVSGLRRTQAWAVRTPCVQRGVFRLGPVRLVTGDPFGLFEMKRRLDAVAELVVLPAMVALSDFELPQGVLPGGDALREHTHQVTANAAGVREYLPGDSFGRIHWRSTARRGRLMVKEFELDPTADLWIMLDGERRVQAGRHSPEKFLAEVLAAGTRQPFRIPATSEEYGVTVAASLAAYFLRRERAVGFASYGQRHQVLQVDRGERQLLKILEALAVLQARGKMTLEQVLVLEGDRLARGAALIIITPSVREAWVAEAARLKRRGVNVIAVVVDAESFGGRPGAKRMTDLLATYAIPACTVKNGEDIALALTSTRI